MAAIVQRIEEDAAVAQGAARQEEAGAQVAQLAVTRGRIASEVRATLTPEQQEKAKGLLARAFGHGLMERLRSRLNDPLAGL